MVYVVEIEGAVGTRALKEYDASSAYELNSVVKHDLRRYPRFRVTAWLKTNPDRPVFIGSP